MSTLRWVPMCQGFNHFIVSFASFYVGKITSSTQNVYFIPWSIIMSSQPVISSYVYSGSIILNTASAWNLTPVKSDIYWPLMVLYSIRQDSSSNHMRERMSISLVPQLPNRRCGCMFGLHLTLNEETSHHPNGNPRLSSSGNTLWLP